MPARTLDRLRRVPAVWWLALVAAAFAVTQVALLPLDTFLSWDEAIYASQFSGDVQRMAMSAHRSSGVPLLLAPVTLLTESTTAIRGYLTVVSTLALFVAYRVWVPVDTRVAVLGALLFASSSATLVNAHQALPNVLTALAAVATVGCFAVAGQRARGGRAALAGVTTALAVASLLRPTDAAFLAIALLAAVVVVRRWRRLPLAVAVAGGLAVGGAAWLVEAWTQFGGPLQRLAAMRDTTQAGADPVVLQWLVGYPRVVALVLAVAVVVLTAAVVGVRRVGGGWPAPVWVLTVATAATMVLPYYLLLSYTSDRYALPAQGLLALAAAAACRRLVTASAGTATATVSTGLVAAVTAYAVVQVTSAAVEAHGVQLVRGARAGYAERLGELGTRPPCVVTGVQAPAFAYTLGCTTGDVVSPVPSDAATDQAFVRDRATARRLGARLVVVRYGDERPPGQWHRVRLEERKPIYAYVPATP